MPRAVIWRALVVIGRWRLSLRWVVEKQLSTKK